MCLCVSPELLEMGAAPGSAWEEGEFEFKLVFEEDPGPRQSQGPSPGRTAEPERSSAGEESQGVPLQLEPSCSSSSSNNLGQKNFIFIHKEKRYIVDSVNIVHVNLCARACVCEREILHVVCANMHVPVQYHLLYVEVKGHSGDSM